MWWDKGWNGECMGETPLPGDLTAVLATSSPCAGSAVRTQASQPSGYLGSEVTMRPLGGCPGRERFSWNKDSSPLSPSAGVDFCSLSWPTAPACLLHPFV